MWIWNSPTGIGAEGLVTSPWCYWEGGTCRSGASGWKVGHWGLTLKGVLDPAPLCLSGCPEVHIFALPYAPCHDGPSTGPKQQAQATWTGTSDTVRQNKSFLLLKYFSPAFCHSDRKLSSTANEAGCV